MNTVKKLITIRDVPRTLALETRIELHDLYATFIVELPTSISKVDFDNLCHLIDEELIKQGLTIRDTYVLHDFGTFHFHVNYPIR